MRDRHWRGTRECALLAAMLAALLPQSAVAFDDAALARQVYEGIVLPGYARFEMATRTFVDRAGALCAAPSDARLKTTRAAAREALLAWGRIEPIRFGPITQQQRLERLLFHPDPHGIVAKQTAKLLAKRDEADIDPERLAGASVAIQGFGAVDAVLFGKGSEALATDDHAAAFRCRYLQSLAGDIAEIARETHAEWAGAYGSTWLHSGPENNTYLSPQETTQALYRAYITELEVIRLQRLAPLFGGGGKTAPPATPLLPHSGLGLDFILAGIAGESELLGKSGFLAADLAGDDNERAAIAVLGSVATDLGFAARAGEAAIALSARPLADPKARERLTPMLSSLKNAEDTGRAALGALTGQTLGFNSLDGD